MPQQDLRVRPSAWWYALTVVLWIASFVVFVIAILPIISIFSDGVETVQNHRRIPVTSDGFTVYASASSPNATCTLTGGGPPIRLTQFDQAEADNITFSLTNGPDVHPLATTPDDIDPGTYTLSCQGVPQTAVLATGKRLDFTDFAGRLAVGIVVALALGMAGLVWLIVMLVRRHKSKDRMRQAQAAAAYGYAYPPGSYPGNAQGGYPQSPQYGYPQAPQAGYPPGSPPSPPAEDRPSGDAAGTPYGTPPPPPSPESPTDSPQPPDHPERRE